MAKRNFAITNEGEPGPRPVEKAAGRISESLEKLINDRTRLGMLSALAANEKISFTDLKNLLSTTDGNISVHARKLEDAGYLVCEKSFRGRTPLTEYAITSDGRAALEKYLDHMEALIRAMRG